MTGILRLLDRWLQTVLRYLCTLLFIVLGLILLANVFLRLINDLSIFLTAKGFAGLGQAVKSLQFMTSMHWFDEIVELCFAALVFYGAAALWAVKGHFSVGDWISRRLPWPRMRALYKLGVTLISAAFIAVFFWYSRVLTVNTSEMSTVFQIPKMYIYSCMPIASFIMLLYSAADIAADVKALLFGSSDGSGIQESQSM